MHIRRLVVENFRCLRSVSAAVGAFGCIVGENNAGKSTVLHALRFAVGGGSLGETDFYDRSGPCFVDFEFDDVTESDLLRLENDEHQRRLAPLVRNRRLTLRRISDAPGASSRLLVGAKVHREERFRPKVAKELLKGLRAADVGAAVAQHFPELGEAGESLRTQKAALEAINEYVNSLDESHFEDDFVSLPTGVSTSIQNLLPDVVYIEAVKDASVEVKTSDRSTFGKLLRLLLQGIEETEQMRSIRASLDELRKLTNVVEEDDQLVDGRLAEVRLVEELVSETLAESFPGIEVGLEVPEPELKQIFAGARLKLDDGVPGYVESKGDGLKRSVVFALIRSYVKFRQHRRAQHADKAAAPAAAAGTRPLLFLFEEPELYLHPRGQRILFQALRTISDEHQVLVTTHSPLFLSPEGDTSFYKVTKQTRDDGPPEGVLKAVNLLDDMTAKDAYQLICFENNAAGFFARKVLLVEGPSDVVFFRHIGRVLGGAWDFDAENVPVLPMHSKSNFAKYRSFLREFGVDAPCVLDSDALLEGVPGMSALDGVRPLRDALFARLDGLAVEEGVEVTETRSRVKQIVKSRTFRERYLRLRELSRVVADGQREWTDEERIEFDLLFERDSYSPRRMVLDNHWDELAELEPLLSALRQHGIVVLRKGAVEQYYPGTVVGSDKPAKALAAARELPDEDAIRAVFPEVATGAGSFSELDLLMTTVMGPRS